MDKIGIEQARMQLGEIIDRARIAGLPTLITRQGKPAAVVVGYDWHTGISALMEDVFALGEYRERFAGLRDGRWSAGLPSQDPRAISHIDGDPRNNDPANLEIIDPEENQ